MENKKSPEVKLAELETKVKSLEARQKTITEKVAKSIKTDWGLLASWAGVLLTFAGGVAWMALSPVETEVLRLRNWKQSTNEKIRIITKENAIYRERIRALERKIFEEPKDV